MILFNGSMDDKIDEMTDLILKDQSQTRTIMKQGFVGVATQNQELLEQNRELKEQLKSMQDQLESVSQILEEKLEQERLLEEKRQRRKNQKRLAKRESITKEIYELMISETYTLSYSHSFRIGFITQLWKDTNDVEFVRQAIGHQKLDTTSAYVTKLSDQERQERTLQLK